MSVMISVLKSVQTDAPHAPGEEYRFPTGIPPGVVRARLGDHKLTKRVLNPKQAAIEPHGLARPS